MLIVDTTLHPVVV